MKSVGCSHGSSFSGFCDEGDDGLTLNELEVFFLGLFLFNFREIWFDLGTAGTSSYVLTLGDTWSSSTIDLYLHHK
jgi:hypothetical protein